MFSKMEGQQNGDRNEGMRGGIIQGKVEDKMEDRKHRSDAGRQNGEQKAQKRCRKSEWRTEWKNGGQHSQAKGKNYNIHIHTFTLRLRQTHTVRGSKTVNGGSRVHISVSLSARIDTRQIKRHTHTQTRKTKNTSHRAWLTNQQITLYVSLSARINTHTHPNKENITPKSHDSQSTPDRRSSESVRNYSELPQVQLAGPAPRHLIVDEMYGREGGDA